MRLRDAVYNMFGFLVTEPIHKSLRHMRLVQVGLIVSSQMLLFRIVDGLGELDPTQAAIAYGAIAATLITAIWKAVDGLHKSNEKD